MFAWVADFVRARVDDPELNEKLRQDALSGYLFIGNLPDGIREEIIQALRDDLVPEMESGPPVNSIFDEKVRHLARLAAGGQ